MMLAAVHFLEVGAGQTSVHTVQELHELAVHLVLDRDEVVGLRVSGDGQGAIQRAAVEGHVPADFIGVGTLTREVGSHTR